MTLLETVQRLESEKEGLHARLNALQTTMQAEEHDAMDAFSVLGSVSHAVETLDRDMESILSQHSKLSADIFSSNEARRHLEQLLLLERLKVGELEQSLIESSQIARDAASQLAEFSIQVQVLWDAKVALERKVL